MSIPLAACASMSGFPEPVQPPANALAEVEDYLTLAVVNRCNRNPTKACRNNIIDARVRASNIRFAEYERQLYSEGIGSGVGTDWAVLALNGIAAISTGAAPELAALSAGVLGGRAAYEKRALYDLSLPVMLAQMSARRKEVLVSIRSGETMSVEDYSLHRGLDEVADYERAGSIPAAMKEMVNNAGAQARDAEAKLEQIDRRLRFACEGLSTNELNTAVNPVGDFFSELFGDAAEEAAAGGTDARARLDTAATAIGVMGVESLTLAQLDIAVDEVMFGNFCTMEDVDALKTDLRQAGVGFTAD